MNPVASVLMAAALISYTIGVWGERVVGRLKWWNFAFFVLGLIFDTIGNGISGLLAIVLMAIHAAWALVVLLRGDERAKRTFHRFSIVVWCIWLIPYLSPMVIAMAR